METTDTEPQGIVPCIAGLAADDLRYIARALTLLAACPPTVRQVIEAGNDAIEASGLNPWCMNEGRADGTEEVTLWWLNDVSEKVKRAANKQISNID